MEKVHGSKLVLGDYFKLQLDGPVYIVTAHTDTKSRFEPWCPHPETPEEAPSMILPWEEVLRLSAADTDEHLRHRKEPSIA